MKILKLIEHSKIMQVLLHVSTAYCNCIRERVEEKVYESPFGWQEAISIAENLDSTMTSILTKK